MSVAIGWWRLDQFQVRLDTVVIVCMRTRGWTTEKFCFCRLQSHQVRVRLSDVCLVRLEGPNFALPRYVHNDCDVHLTSEKLGWRVRDLFGKRASGWVKNLTAR